MWQLRAIFALCLVSPIWGIKDWSRRVAAPAPIRKRAAVGALPPGLPAQTPVIGILAQPTDRVITPDQQWMYFADSYNLYASMAGAQTVPVLCDSTPEELADLYSKINGLIVPGGSQDLVPGNCYYDAVVILMDLAMREHDATGEMFPMHFTCLGFEAASVKVTNNTEILGTFVGVDGVHSTLNWTDAAETATALQRIPRAVRAAAEVLPITYEAHHNGVTVEDFWNTNLSKFFTLLSTAVDTIGQVYVSTVQAKQYPFIGTQWHPEKNNFEWLKPAIPHTLKSVQLSQGIANQFVEWSRQSTHRFPSQHDLDLALLKNYRAIKDPEAYFVQVFAFPMRKAPGGPRPSNPFYTLDKK